MHVGRVGEVGVCPGLYASLCRMSLHGGHEVECVVGRTEEEAVCRADVIVGRGRGE